MRDGIGNKTDIILLTNASASHDLTMGDLQLEASLTYPLKTTKPDRKAYFH